MHTALALPRPAGGCFACRRWNPSGIAYVRKAGLLYSWSLRHLVLVAPIVAFLLHPGAGVPAALVVTWVLSRFDRLRLTRNGDADAVQ